MAISIKITLNEKLYLRDPQGSDLGQRIIKHSILLIEEIGFEAFTFKKLSVAMKSTEASVYRYFENKHLLLLYLVTWYWQWVQYLIEVATMNMQDPKEKLRTIIHTLVHASKDNPSIEYVNESVLHRVVIAEGSKAYHTKSVDAENKEGFFLSYKQLIQLISETIVECQPSFPYPHALASNLFEMRNNHIFFAQHLPRLTDVSVKTDDFEEVEQMLQYFAFNILTSQPEQQISHDK